MSVLSPPVSGDRRRSCRHCGTLQKHRGLASHERQCAANPARVLVGAAAPTPAPAPVQLFPALSATAARALEIAVASHDRAVSALAWRRYIAERARDFGILQEAS